MIYMYVMKKNPITQINIMRPSNLKDLNLLHYQIIKWILAIP